MYVMMVKLHVLELNGCKNVSVILKCGMIVDYSNMTLVDNCQYLTQCSIRVRVSIMRL